MYCLNDLAMMTGLHTRTLRNYIKRGVLHGSKRGGKNGSFPKKRIMRFWRIPQ